jgi:hypothetical protein
MRLWSRLRQWIGRQFEADLAEEICFTARWSAIIARLAGRAGTSHWCLSSTW